MSENFKERMWVWVKMKFYRETCRHCDNKICEFSPAYLWRYPYKKL